MTCLSKAFGLFACMEWGLADFKVVSPYSFTAKRKGKKLSFLCTALKYNKSDIPIGNFSEDFIMILIDGKPKDNFIIVKGSEIESFKGGRISLIDLSKVIKYKTRFYVEGDILHDGHSSLQKKE